MFTSVANQWKEFDVTSRLFCIAVYICLPLVPCPNTKGPPVSTPLVVEISIDVLESCTFPLLLVYLR